MQHDHDHAPHRGCSQTGFMSYGKNRPDKWSTCSIDDFKIWWRRSGSKCEEVIADYDTTTSMFLVFFQVLLTLFTLVVKQD